jgi:site-specific recombinase XerD
MAVNYQLVHERMLAGAVESYLHSLVHVRAFLVTAYSDVLEELVQRWLDEGGANVIDAPTTEWLGSFLATQDDHALAVRALDDFYQWALRNQLIEVNPLLAVADQVAVRSTP